MTKDFLFSHRSIASHVCSTFASYLSFGVFKYKSQSEKLYKKMKDKKKKAEVFKELSDRDTKLAAQTPKLFRK